MVIGGSVPVFDEVILSTTLMDKVISVDQTSGIYTTSSFQRGYMSLIDLMVQ